MKSLILTGVLSWVCCAGFAAEITITGPTVVCPNVQYTYEASASNLFGTQNGCFSWSFWVNGQMVWTSGGVGCETCNSQTHLSSKPFIWNTVTNNAQVKVQFVANDELPGCLLSTKIVNVIVRVVMPISISDNTGGLTFCSPGQTKIISSPHNGGPANCNWNHNYDWIVPSGWSIVPSDPFYTYAAISGGIRTKAPSVNITASSSLSSGYTGNYFITVRTEPSWLYPKEISRQIWVGTPSVSIGAQQQPICPDPTIYHTYYSYVNGYPDQYSWNIPGDAIAHSGVLSEPTLLLSFDSDPPCYYTPGDTRSLGLTVYNQCGSTSQGYTIQFAYDCYYPECNFYSPSDYSVFPNPASDYVEITLPQQENEISKASQNKKDVTYTVKIYDRDGLNVYTGEKKSNPFTISTARFKNGLYVIETSDKKNIYRQRLQVNH